MADVTWYAWSPIVGGTSDEVIKVAFGEEVTKSKLMLDNVGWLQLRESGAVRTIKPPDIPETWQDSPINYYLDQAKKAAEGVMAGMSESPEVMAAAQIGNAAATGDPGAQQQTTENQS